VSGGKVRRESDGKEYDSWAEAFSDAAKGDHSWTQLTHTEEKTQVTISWGRDVIRRLFRRKR